MSSTVHSSCAPGGLPGEAARVHVSSLCDRATQNISYVRPSTGDTERLSLARAPEHCSRPAHSRPTTASAFLVGMALAFAVVGAASISATIAACVLLASIAVGLLLAQGEGS